MDACGKDIKIENSDLAVRNGDFQLTSGLDTINQAITSRLNTTINSRVRNVVYGIRNESGIPENGKDAAATYISASVEQTLLADPRVESVETLEWTGTGAALSIHATYTTISGEKMTYIGVV